VGSYFWGLRIAWMRTCSRGCVMFVDVEGAFEGEEMVVMGSVTGISFGLR
jgi:hypothetical protein